MHWRCTEGCDDGGDEPAVEPITALAPYVGPRFGPHAAAAVPAAPQCGHSECSDFCHRSYSGEIWL